MTKILALKVGPTTGLAIGSTTGHLVSRSLNLENAATTLAVELARLHAAYGPSAIYVEAPPRPERRSERQSLDAELRQVVVAHAASCAVPVHFVSTRRHRRNWTGRSCSAEEIVASARARGLAPQTLAEADALSIFHCAATCETPYGAVTRAWN